MTFLSVVTRPVQLDSHSFMINVYYMITLFEHMCSGHIWIYENTEVVKRIYPIQEQLRSLKTFQASSGLNVLLQFLFIDNVRLFGFCCCFLFRACICVRFTNNLIRDSSLLKAFMDITFNFYFSVLVDAISDTLWILLAKPSPHGISPTN